MVLASTLDDPANVVTGLYRQILQREPDAGGLQGYEQMIVRGASVEQVAESMWESPEFRNFQVSNYYHQFLNREPEAAGLAGWVKYLEDGHSEEEVIASMTASDEFFATNGGNNADFIESLYIDLLGRLPNAQESTGWLTAMEKGTTRTSVASAFVNSGEYRLASVESIYQYVLDRDPDVGGLQYYSTHNTVDNWIHTTSIEIVSSQENLDRLVALTDIPAPNVAVMNLYKSMFAGSFAEFVGVLKLNFLNPSFVASIENGTNDGQLTDEVTPSTASVFDVRRLRPTQNEIVMQNSLSVPLTNAATANQYLDGGVISVAGQNVLTGDDGIYIIDGHHRWSQIFIFNPGRLNSVSITATDLPTINDPFLALEATHLGIVSATGTSPSSAGGGDNLYTVDFATFADYVTNTVTVPVLSVFAAHGIGTMGSNLTAVINYLWENVLLLREDNQPITGSAAPSRILMPQTDSTTIAAILNDLNSGIVNYRSLYYRSLGG